MRNKSISDRIHVEYKRGGISGLAKTSRRAAVNWLRQPPLWTRFRWISRFLARRIPPKSPPVLIISYPSSGSTWVGTTLGYAADAMYLNEPFNHNFNHIYPGFNTFLDPEGDEHPNVSWYRLLIDYSFEGFPSFPVFPYVISYPDQWKLRHRRQRRLVIKEVNLAALSYIIRRYNPRIILLIRHPAGVATSEFRRGWISKIDEEFGRNIGTVLKTAWEVLASYPQLEVVLYEELCLNPVDGFRQLIRFADLEWDGSLREIVQERSFGALNHDSNYLIKDSKSKAWAWRHEIDRNSLQRLWNGYAEFDLPWYQSVDMWNPRQ